jgi:hypothetical protein
MALLLTKLRSKLELPANDWVLARFGRFEASEDPGTTPLTRPGAGAPASSEASAANVSASLPDQSVDQEAVDDSASPPQSMWRVSQNASVDAGSEIPPEHKSRAR